jgi:hypothetical protein
MAEKLKLSAGVVHIGGTPIVCVADSRLNLSGGMKVHQAE